MRDPQPDSAATLIARYDAAETDAEWQAARDRLAGFLRWCNHRKARCYATWRTFRLDRRGRIRVEPPPDLKLFRGDDEH